MVLLGMVPVLMQHPPIVSIFSISATCFPNLAPWIAARCPAGPEPITTRSKVCMPECSIVPRCRSLQSECLKRSQIGGAHSPDPVVLGTVGDIHQPECVVLAIDQAWPCVRTRSCAAATHGLVPVFEP